MTWRAEEISQNIVDISYNLAFKRRSHVDNPAHLVVLGPGTHRGFRYCIIFRAIY